MDFTLSEPLFATLRGFQLYVGFSGGADSTALLLLTAETAPRFECRVTAVHFNHHLRGAESDAEAEAAEKFATERHLPFLRYDLDCGNGSEAEAREARLAVWKKLAADRSKTAVLLGHHADDRAENLLLRLARGANASGAAALRSSAVVAGVRFIRPLLPFRRAEIESWLKDQGITGWAQDSSNFKENARRNAVRLRLLPELYRIFPEAASGLQRSLDALEADARFIETLADDAYRAGDPHLRSFWEKQPEALGFRLFRRFCSEFAGRELLPDRVGWERFCRMIETGECGLLPLSCAITLKLTSQKITLYHKPVPPEPVVWDWQTIPEIRCGQWRFRVQKIPRLPLKFSLAEAAFDAAALPCPLRLAPPKPGETMIPFGKTTPEKLKKMRIDRHVAPEDMPLLLKTLDDAVLWAPQVRHSALYPGHPESEMVLFSVEKAENHL